jgi:hypothetical protein
VQFAIDQYSAVIKLAENSNATKGRVGTALLPGTSRVLNRTSGQLVPCSLALCSDVIVRQGVMRDGAGHHHRHHRYTALARLT